MTVMGAAGDPPPAGAMLAALERLEASQVVAVPTDTVYGLAAVAGDPVATDRLFAVKARPRHVDLPVLVAGLDQLEPLVAWLPAMAERLALRFWPGALTLVLPRRAGLVADLGSDDATIGVRCPAHPVPLALCGRAGPLATTSANRHGQPEMTTAGEVASAFETSVPLVLDAGPCRGAPSTVVDCTGESPRCLRPGGVSWEEVVAVAG